MRTVQDIAAQKKTPHFAEGRLIRFLVGTGPKGWLLQFSKRSPVVTKSFEISERLWLILPS